MSESATFRVAVTGSNGQLGNELYRIADRFPRFHFSFLSRSGFPLDNPDRMLQWMKDHPVDYFIHCAAYTAVDKAESDKEKAMAVNATAAGLIASQLSTTGGRLIYISTDYVFDGNSAEPLTEEAPTHPVNWYGETKLKGEQLVLQNNPQTQVIRTSWVYSSFGNNFVRTMIRLMKEKTSINVVADQRGSPTYAGDLAKSILQILDSGNWVPGIFHYSNEGETSWYGLADEIRKNTGSLCEVLPIPSSGFPTPAKRPAYSLMDKSKIKKVYGLTIPDWQTSLYVCLEELKKQTV